MQIASRNFTLFADNSIHKGSRWRVNFKISRAIIFSQNVLVKIRARVEFVWKISRSEYTASGKRKSNLFTRLRNRSSRRFAKNFALLRILQSVLPRSGFSPPIGKSCFGRHWQWDPRYRNIELMQSTRERWIFHAYAVASGARYIKNADVFMELHLLTRGTIEPERG